MIGDLRYRLLSTMFICIVVAASAGCTTMKTIDPVTDPAAPAFASVQLGDTVEIQTRGGVGRIVVREVDRDSIVSADGRRYSRDEILRLRRQTTSATKTTWLVVGVFSTLMHLVLQVL